MGIDKNQLRELITETLKEIDMYSESAVNLLMGTAAQESHLGKYIKQIKGPALGIFQMEPATHNDLWLNYLKYKPKIAAKLNGYGSWLAKYSAPLLIHNLKYAIIMCRIHYLRVPTRLPKANNITGLALYYKRHYNTWLGSGTVGQFKTNYNKYVK